jgi:FkbM family methyltransferase
MKARFRDDREEIRFLREVVVPGTAVVDAGAYKGAYLYWLQRYTGPRGRVFAFEPQPALYRYLKSIKQRMGWAHVEILPQALSDHEGTGMLKEPPLERALMANPFAAGHGMSFRSRRER